jgi:transitional endoplasmic reticulum ATPase
LDILVITLDRKTQIIKKAEQVIVLPIEELNMIGMVEHLTEILEGRVVSRRDIILRNIMSRNKN